MTALCIQFEAINAMDEPGKIYRSIWKEDGEIVCAASRDYDPKTLEKITPEQAKNLHRVEVEYWFTSRSIQGLA